MKVILLRGHKKKPIKISLSKWHLFISVLLVLNLVLFLQFFNFTHSNSSLQKDFEILSQRFATMEAQTQRLNMLGIHIAKQASIDIEAFNLSQQPALGGITGQYIEPVSKEMTESQLIESIRYSESILFNQKIKLDDEKRNKINKDFSQQYLSPVNKGYISSNFGMRTDPINGKHRHHKGIDIAGKKGATINTIASGFVTFVGKKGGYGNVVEIHHSDSLKSRYAHLNKILVKDGAVVRKGEKIATMGMTGRVTGPHLHIEVWKDGMPVNPKNYVNLVLGTSD